MHPGLLAVGLSACLILVGLPEPQLDFLPSEPVEEFAVAGGAEAVYSWRGSYFDQQPAIKEVMRQHGYEGKQTVSASDCFTTFTRDDGSVVKISIGKWRAGAPRGALDSRRREYITAEVQQSDIVKRSCLNLLKRLHIRP